MAAQALSDLKVVDLAHHIVGPSCTKTLADFGAEVIKVERPGTGDPARQMGPFFHDEPDKEKSGLFLHLNTNKKSITVNLKSKTGVNIVKELVKDADVLVENFAPRVMPSLGLSYEVLEKMNPRLVMTSISNFGQTGPYRDYKATDLTMHAFAGALAGSGEIGREPYKMGGAQAQLMTGRVAFIATMGAIFGMDQTGEGQHVDVSIMEATASNEFAMTAIYVYSGLVQGRKRLGVAPGHPAGPYPCRNGYVNVLIGVGHMGDLANLVGRPEMAEERWFRDHRFRLEHREEFDREFMLPYLMQHTREEIVEQAQALGMPFITSIDMSELLVEPQFKAREFFVDVEHPATGKVTYPGAPFKMSATPWQAGRAPLLGEHNEEIYCDRLGYTKAELLRLYEAGII